MNSEQSLILAVDCGSTNLKIALFTQELERVYELSTPVVYTVNDGCRMEFDPQGIRTAFSQAIDRLLTESGTPAADVGVVAFGSQAQTFCMVESASGDAVTPFFSWLDKRAEKECVQARAELGTNFHEHCSFAPAIPQLEVCKALWLKDRQPKSMEESYHHTFLPGYLAMGLGAPNTVDRNLAAMGGMYSLRTGKWWTEALALCGLSTEQMPRLVDVGEGIVTKHCPKGCPFEPGLRIVYAGNDQTAGAFGNGCDEDGVLVTLGTALVAYACRGDSPGPFHKSTFWGPYPGGSWYELATRDEGCFALDQARKTIASGVSTRWVDDAALSVIEQDLVENAPLFLPGEAGSAGAWTTQGTDEQKAYAILEGISFSLRTLLEEDMSLQCSECDLSVIGGGSRSEVWLRIIASTLGCSICRGTGDGLLGAAAMALGVEPPQVGRGPRISPDPQLTPILDKRYSKWRRKNLKSTI